MENSVNMLKKSYFYEEDERYPVSNQSLAEIFEEAANREDQNYVTWHRPSERYTYRQLYQRAQNVAKGMMVAGLEKGDCVLGVGCQGSDGIVTFMAATSIGLIFTCPYIYAPTFKTLSTVIEMVKPGLILVGNVNAGAKLDRTFMSLNDVLKDSSDTGKTLPLVYYDSISAQIEDCMKCNLFAQPLSSLIEQGSSIPDADLKAKKSKTGTKTPCYYAFTSGSTGTPKVVMHGCNLFVDGFNRRNERLGITKDNHIVGIQNMIVDDTLFLSDFNAALRVGYPVIIFPKPENYGDEAGVIREICECVQQHQVTFLSIDQSSTRRITQTPSLRNEYDLTSVKGWVLTAAPISESIKRDIFKYYPETIDYYGLTELGMITAPMPGLNHKKPSSMGRPVSYAEVKIVNEDGTIVNCGVRGEILVKMSSTFLCYKNQPELTKKMFTEDGFLKTGDCGWMDDDGDLFFVSRLSTTERYKVYFDVVYAAPIEHVLSGHPKIKESCVIGINCSTNMDGHDICYCIVLKEASSLTLEEVKTYAIENMENQREWPRRIIFMDKLPRQGARQKLAKLKLIKDLEKEVETEDSMHKVEYELIDT